MLSIFKSGKNLYFGLIVLPLTKHNLASDSSKSPYMELAEKEMRETLLNSIKSLPEEEQKVVSLYYFSENKMKEIAKLLGLAASSVSRIHASAILKLKNILSNINTKNEPTKQVANIQVIGVGDAGCSIVNNTSTYNIETVDFIVINDDVKQLNSSRASTRIKLRENLTETFSANSNFVGGEKLFIEDIGIIKQKLKKADLLFLVAGMGGRTGTNLTPVIARAAKEEGVPTYAIVTKPIFYEGKLRTRIANEGIKQLEKHVTSLIVVPINENLGATNKGLSLLDMFRLSDTFIGHIISSISKSINSKNLVNLEVADMSNITGRTFVGMGKFSGNNRVKKALQRAVTSMQPKDFPAGQVKNVIVLLVAGDIIEPVDIINVTNLIQKHTCDDINIIYSANIDPSLNKMFQITIFADGLIGKGVIH